MNSRRENRLLATAKLNSTCVGGIRRTRRWVERIVPGDNVVIAGARLSTGLLLVALAAVLGTGCPSGPTLGNDYVGTTTCLACHNGQSGPDYTSYKESVHYAEGVGCEDCHGPGKRHVQAVGRGGDLFINNPDEGGFENSYASCVSCHETEVSQFLKSGHAKDQVATCNSCHTVHRKDTWYLPFEDNRLCLYCHGQTDFPDDDAIVAHTFHENMPNERASLCIGCHMQPLSRENQDEGDFNHSLIPVEPEVTIDAINAGISPAPANSCAGVAGCHDGTNEEAPYFNVDDVDVNERLQRIFDQRYEGGAEVEGESEGEAASAAPAPSAQTAAALRLIRGQ